MADGGELIALAPGLKESVAKTWHTLPDGERIFYTLPGTRALGLAQAIRKLICSLLHTSRRKISAAGFRSR